MNRLKAIGAKLLNRIKEEPVLVSYAALLIVNAAAFVGFDIDPALIAQFDAVVVPMLAILTRQQVAPMSSLKKMSPEELVEVVHGE